MVQEMLIKYIVAGGLIVGCGWLLYDKVHDAGFRKAELKYTKIIEDYKLDLSKKTIELEVTSNILEDNRRDSLNKLNLTLEDMMKEFRRSGRVTTVITKEGKCVPSADFVDIWNKTIEKVNEQIITNINPTK